MKDCMAERVNNLLDETTGKIVEAFKEKKEEILKNGESLSIEMAAIESLIEYTTSDEFRDNLIKEMLNNM